MRDWDFLIGLLTIAGVAIFFTFIYLASLAGAAHMQQQQLNCEPFGEILICREGGK